jgi:hypothetical protein
MLEFEHHDVEPTIGMTVVDEFLDVGFCGDSITDPKTGRTFWGRPVLDYLEQYLREAYNKTKDDIDPDLCLGYQRIMDIVLDCIPISKISPFQTEEIFGLLHTDLDPQNVLVDDDGNVTVIIDW